MFVLRILRWLWGYVTFRARGQFPERFMNLTARARINLWDVKSSQGQLTGSVLCKQYRLLRPIARKSNMCLHVCKKRGLPFHWAKYRRRLGLLVGAALFAATLYVLSLYVWDININGNQILETEQIEQVIADLGIRPGTMKRDIDSELLEQSTMVRLPEISWIAINMYGSHVDVEIKERTAPPEIVPKDQPCNMKAARAGQVLRMEVYEGAAAVKEGDAVLEGQMLINGVVEDAFGGNALKHAAGRVFAETKRNLSVQIPLKQTISTPTDHVITRKRLRVFGFEIPISFAAIPDENYERELISQPIMVGETKLPLMLYTERWTEQRVEEITLTEAQAKKQAEEKMTALEASDLGTVKILSRDYTGKVVNGVYLLEATYTCEEDIAVESKILFAE